MILGTSAALQAHGRHQSAQIIRNNNHCFLIDCGEGTQGQIKKHKINSNKINKVFISHLHGDHFLGLFGLISTMSLLGRDKALTIYGPAGLKEILTIQLKYSQSVLNYLIEFVETQALEKALLFSDQQLEVYSFPLSHGVLCTGFLLKEKPKARQIVTAKLPKGVNNVQLKQLKKGIDIVLPDGQIVDHLSCTNPAPASYSYAYCSDTSYQPTTAF
jgi:ribonuclease Z